MIPSEDYSKLQCYDVPKEWGGSNLNKRQEEGRNTILLVKSPLSGIHDEWEEFSSHKTTWLTPETTHLITKQIKETKSLSIPALIH